jgi:hypothetical protein
MPWYIQLVLWAVPLASGAIGAWQAIQWWLAKRQGRNEQALSDSLDSTKAENDALKRVAEADAVSRSMSVPDKLRDAKRRGLI